jgi:MazG family protein
MSNAISQPGASLARLVAIMERLLAPDGCPWDREQTLETLRPFLVEETYEVLDALDAGEPRAHCEELGDLLMQIVFQAALRAREGSFGIDDVVAVISDKLERRHPHVFGDARADDAEAVLTQWGEIKAAERRGQRDDASPDRALAGVPRSLPALARAQQISSRAARVGFDWTDAAGCRAKVAEELVELDSAIATGHAGAVESELGDLLYATVSLARKLGVDAEGALRGAIDKFERRFERVEDRLHQAGRGPRDADLEELDGLWNAVKREPS